jgi:D-glycero-D-manno-heptose 1,7-bisphosphate phosphatase
MPVSAVLLDRDGTINVKAAEGDYIAHPDEVVLLPGAAAAIGLLNARRIPVAVVTNQRGIALGRMTEADLAAVHRRLAALLAAEGAKVDAVFYCPHHAGACACRKPGTLMLEQAAVELGVDDFADVVMIGDSASDVLAGRRLGARTVFLGSPEGAPSGSECAPELLAAVRVALA